MASDSGDDSGYSSKSMPEFNADDIERLQDSDSEEVPLQTPWTFWFDKSLPGVNAEQYEKNLKKIYTVKTVQGFWAVFNNIPGADELQPRYSYHLMKEERRPLWEDKVNQEGGTWRFKCLKRDTTRVWKELLLAAIGEQFVDCMAENDSVCGITVTARDKDDLIQVWNVIAELSDDSTIIDKISNLLPDVNFLAKFYKPHQTHHAYGGTAGNQFASRSSR
ncbi:eukaryotic translation initiation factor 4E type 3-like [Lycorma delicatula]|uniref:eukaryotic translation initiation factor 4E type 3-like n=1 Tax=Lycorma delicatula TaxID=130591 RepID=UPI003F50EE3C